MIGRGHALPCHPHRLLFVFGRLGLLGLKALNLTGCDSSLHVFFSLHANRSVRSLPPSVGANGGGASVLVLGSEVIDTSVVVADVLLINNSVGEQHCLPLPLPESTIDVLAINHVTMDLCQGSGPNTLLVHIEAV